MMAREDSSFMAIQMMSELDKAFGPMFKEFDLVKASIRASIKATNRILRANGIEPFGDITEQGGL